MPDERPAARPAGGTSGAGRWRWSVLLGVLASCCGVALTVTSGWLITRASEHPPLLFLMVAIVAVRAFGIGRPLLRYAERLVGHDSALRMLAERRVEVYDTLVPLTPGALGRRRGDLLAGVVDDVDALLDDRLRVRSPLLSLVGVGTVAAVLGWVLFPVTGPLVAALLAVTLLVAVLVRGTVGRAEHALVRDRAALSTEVVAVVQGARDLVLWQAGPEAVRRVDALGTALASAVRRSARPGRARPVGRPGRGRPDRRRAGCRRRPGGRGGTAAGGDRRGPGAAAPRAPRRAAGRAGRGRHLGAHPRGDGPARGAGRRPPRR